MRPKVFVLASSLCVVVAWFTPAAAHVPDDCAFATAMVAEAARSVERENANIVASSEVGDVMGVLRDVAGYMGSVNDLSSTLVVFMRCLSK